MPKQSNDLSRKGEPKQRTKSGLTIPVPERDELFGALTRTTGKQPAKKPSARSGRGKRRPSRGQ
jgi:hypothetical protein